VDEKKNNLFPGHLMNSRMRTRKIRRKEPREPVAGSVTQWSKRAGGGLEKPCLKTGLSQSRLRKCKRKREKNAQPLCKLNQAKAK